MKNTRFQRLSEGYYTATVNNAEITIQSELHTEIEGRGWMYFISYTNRLGFARNITGDVYTTLSQTKEFAVAAAEAL